MGNVKYSKISTSNGVIELNKNIYENKFDNYEYIKIYDVMGKVKVYINNINDKNDFILLENNDFELEDIQINSLKVVPASDFKIQFKYVVAK